MSRLGAFFFAVVGLAACGKDEACSDRECTSSSQCPLYECGCADSQSVVLFGGCLEDDECCMNEEAACDEACADLGGWAGR